MADIVFSVSQITEYISRKLFQDPFLSAVQVVGEVTNFSLSSSGHAFFSLKDENSMIGCIIYDFESQEEKDMIADGALLKICGRVTFYRKSASVQLVVETAVRQGVGDLFARFEQTKRRLAEEGLFDISHKKPLPELAWHIGVVTSTSGAVLYDIINVATRRFDGVRITVYPVPVQGVDAARCVCRGIEHFNRSAGVDVIIVARGGGSFEDLFAFNEESVARAVYASHIPVVSAVGHETDYSLCDMAADLRAPTPSAAAELVVKEKQAILESLNTRKKLLARALADAVQDCEQRLSLAGSRLASYPVGMQISRAQDKIAAMQTIMRRSLFGKIESAQLRLEHYLDRLENLNPRGVLKRGYALVYGEDGRVVTERQNATQRMEIEFADGRVAVERKD